MGFHIRQIYYPMEYGIILFWICDYINNRIIVYLIVSIKIYIDKNKKKNKKKLLINDLNNLKKQKLLKKKKKIKIELSDYIIIDIKLDI